MCFFILYCPTLNYTISTVSIYPTCSLVCCQIHMHCAFSGLFPLYKSMEVPVGLMQFRIIRTWVTLLYCFQAQTYFGREPNKASVIYELHFLLLYRYPICFFFFKPVLKGAWHICRVIRRMLMMIVSSFSTGTRRGGGKRKRTN